MASQLQLATFKTVIVPAQLSQRVWGVPSSVTLGQWMLESTWGASQLSVECNNFFGIKAVQGEAYQEFMTHEVVKGRTVEEMADFAKYTTAAACFSAHGKLLATLPRYASAMAVRAQVPLFCIQLQKDGYSTNPGYPTSLMTLIRQHNLTQYDTLPPDQPAQAKEAA